MEHLEPKQAYALLQKNPDAIFIDCRSEMEYLFVGHPSGAIHVAWNDGPNWDINPDFVAHVKKANHFIATSPNYWITRVCKFNGKFTSLRNTH